MIGFYNYTVVLTYIGTMFGFLGLQYIILGQLKQALLCLMAAGFCDMFDGKIASTRKRTRQEKRFGIQIDSLSDLVCFGICNIILFAVSILLAWGGMIYATKNPDQVRIIGFLISFLGYELFFTAVLQYENLEENPS